MTERQTLIEGAAQAHEQALKHRQAAARFTDERDELLMEAWKAGAHMDELAEACGVSVNAVSKALGRPSGRTWTRASPETTKAPSR